MLSLMAAATQDLVIASHRSETRAWEGARADAALNTGIAEAVAGIMATGAGRWRVDGHTRALSIDGLEVQATVQDEAGRYDLNAVDASVLMTLLRAAGLEPARVTALANSILDWRNPAGPHRLDAATDDDYAQAGRPYRPRHAAFQTVEELRLVLGMDPDLFDKIRPAFTVYTKRASIDPAVAPAESLLALYNGNMDQVTAILNARDQGDDSASPLYPSSHMGVLSSAVPLTGKVFDIQLQTRIGEKKYRRETVLTLTGSDRQPYIALCCGTL